MTTTSRDLVHQDTRPPRSAHQTSLNWIDLTGVAGLGAIIAIHTSELSDKVDETAYLGLGYVALIVASIVAIVLVAQRDIRGWVVGGADRRRDARRLHVDSHDRTSRRTR